MSEEILGKNDYRLDETQISLNQEAPFHGGAYQTGSIIERGGRGSGSAFSSPRATQPFGALFVEAYDKVVRQQRTTTTNTNATTPRQQHPWSPSPEKVLFEYTRFLVELIGEKRKSETEREALSLLRSVEDALENKAFPLASSWDPSFVQAVVSSLETHPALKKKAIKERLALCTGKLNTIHKKDYIWTMPPPTHNSSNTSTNNNDLMASLVSGIAERISLSDSHSNNVTRVLADVGPSCTRSAATLREVLADVARTSGMLNEAALASLVYFFSDKSDSSAVSATSGLSSALLGSILSGRGQEGIFDGWNLKSVAQVLREDYSERDWTLVAQSWDLPTFRMKDVNQFRTLLDLFQAGANNPAPLSAFTSGWLNAEGQLSVLECITAVPPTIFMVTLNDEELADAAVTPPPTVNSCPNPQCWASFAILQRLLRLSDSATLYRRVRDLFVKCLLTCPEVLLCSLVRLQLSAANAAAQGEPGSEAVVNAGLQIKTELMRELIPLFFRPSGHHRPQNGPAALRRLYAISPSTVTAACFEAWRGMLAESPLNRLAGIIHIINIARLLPSPTDAVASLLNGSKDPEFSIAIAFVMADNDYLQLKPWLGEKLSSKASAGSFAVSLVSYLRKNYANAGPRSGGVDGKGAPLVSLENVATSLLLLQTVDPSLLNQSVAGLDRTLSFGATLGENVKSLIETCVAAFPSLRSSFVSQNTATPPLSTGAAGAGMLGHTVTADDVEEMATAYFQKIYTSEQSIGEVVEMLKRFKTSGNTKENEIFACMVHNLFDEYRFFSKYPEKELRITGILFGALIQEQLVSSITLGIALRYVLEALRKPPSPANISSSGKMFKFGMFALEQFKGRLHEWPQYCSHIVQIPHLKEGYAELVAEIEQEMAKSQARAAAGAAPAPAQAPSLPPPQQQQQRVPSEQQNGATGPAAELSRHSSSVSDRAMTPTGQPAIRQQEPPAPEVKPRVAEFGAGLGRAVTEGADEEKEFEAPTDAVLDRVQFLVNNLAPSNVEQKSKELQEMLDPKFFGWLGHFLVVKRISTQANFHSLYLSFLDNLGEYGKGLVEAILSSVYHNIGKLLRSPKITTSSSERSYLKNLGIWLGQITLSRNRPILQIMLDCKELLLQGYETGKLIAVAPFLAKTLEGAKNSVIFRPPNPWLMGILSVFRSVYNVEGLKMNIKFEVEVLCKNLGIKLEDIPLRNDILSRRIAPVKERNPDFNIKTSSAQKPAVPGLAAGRGISSPDGQQLGLPPVTAGPAGEDVNRAPPITDQQETMIPNLASYVTVNPSLPQLLQSQGGVALSSLTASSLKRLVPIAVDRAIREIIQPVVERSVTIACITTKEIVTKDFAMESDESKMRNAGQLMVANLAGSLALVTCREPLRASVSTHLRQLLTSNIRSTEKLGEQEQNAIEQCVQHCATDNLELGCMLIQKAATEKAVREVEEALALSVNARRKHREQTGQPFYDMSIFTNGSRYPGALPDALRPKPGGLKAEHFQLYESFQRMPRQSQGQGAVASPGGATAGFVNSRGGTPTAGPEGDAGLQVKQATSQQFGSEALNALASKLDSTVSALLNVAGNRAPEIKLAMLPPEHQIRQLLNAVKQVMPNADNSGGVSRPLTTSEHEIVLSFSQGIFKRLYELSLTEPLRLETLVALLEGINVYCPKLGKDMGTWATYAPTNTEQQRRLHRTVLLLLVRSRLLTVHDLDAFLAARADSGRNHIWVEFSLLFIRTAFMERISTPSDFPRLMDLMTKIVDGRSQASSQVIQAYRKSILRMLEETRGPAATAAEHRPVGVTPQVPPPETPKEFLLEENSSLSFSSLSNMVNASKKVAETTEAFSRNDPQNARQQVTALLDSWIRIQSDLTVSEKAVGQYLHLLQQYGVGKSEEQTERFLRLSMQIVVDAVLNLSPSTDGQRATLNYTFIDMYCKLLVLLFRHMNTGGTVNRVDAQRLGVLNKILGSAVRSMMWHYKKNEASEKKSWDQRPWFRIFMNLIMDLSKPDPTLESIRLGVFSVFGAALHVCQPMVVPGFAFAWLELISHRHFLPNLLLFPGQKAWHIMHQLLIDHLLFLEPYLRKVQLLPPIKKLYEGTLRIFLLFLHDFPLFFASYHLSLCNVIPESCVQLRNIVLSATPKGMSPPDPFTPNLKIDLLPEISQSPAILSNVLGPIEPFRAALDAFLKDGQRRNFLAGLLPLLYKEGTVEVDASKVASLVVYVGAHARARPQSSQISLSRTPEMEVIQKLMELDDKGRYTCLNAIANQLRFPSSHTHYFSCVMLFLFSESKSVAVKEQVTRVLLERLIVNRPHPWGLLVTFIELIKNQRYGFWNYPFTRCATEIEKVFESVARSCLPPGAHRSTLVAAVGDEQ